MGFLKMLQCLRYGNWITVYGRGVVYSWIVHQMDKVRFQIRDQFWIPQPKLHRSKYLIFFVKPQNMLA